MAAVNVSHDPLALPLRTRRALGWIALLESPLIFLALFPLTMAIDAVFTAESVSTFLMLSTLAGYLTLGLGLYAYKIWMALGKVEGTQAQNLLWGHAAYYIVFYLVAMVVAIHESAEVLNVAIWMLPLPILAVWYAHEGRMLGRALPQQA
jgi:hypothetical protein